MDLINISRRVGCCSQCNKKQSMLSFGISWPPIAFPFSIQNTWIERLDIYFQVSIRTHALGKILMFYLGFKDTPYGILGDTLNKKETYNRRKTFWTVWLVPEPTNNPCPNNCHLEAKYGVLCNRVKLHMQLTRTLNHITMGKCHVLSYPNTLVRRNHAHRYKPMRKANQIQGQCPCFVTTNFCSRTHSLTF